MIKILEKYKEYDLDYNWVSNVLFIRKPMLVKDFVRLKNDIKKAGVKLRNIIVVGR